MPNLTGHGTFRKAALPPAKTFFENELGELRRTDSHGNARPKSGCVFCASRTNQPFCVSLRTGQWHCFACGEGGSQVSFLMKRYHIGYIAAMKRLGCWSDSGRLPRRELQPVRYLVLEFKINGQRYRVAVEDEPRNYEDKIRRFYRAASDRLIELSRGDSESYIGEREDCWMRMALGLDELREMEMA